MEARWPQGVNRRVLILTEIRIDFYEEVECFGTAWKVGILKERGLVNIALFKTVIENVTFGIEYQLIGMNLDFFLEKSWS